MTDPHPLLATYGLRLKRFFYSDILWRCAPPAGERVAYLTFDDGPTDEATPRLLDTLARYDARATFFLIGERAARRPGFARTLAGAGHTLGNHTYTHLDASRVPAGAVLDELARTHRLLEDVTGTPVRHVRPPYGRFTDAMRAWCRRRGQRLTMWDVNAGDFRGAATPRRAARHVLCPLRSGSIVLLHDAPGTASVTPRALELLLRLLTRRGWRFAAL